MRISKMTKHLILAEVQVWGMKSGMYDESMLELQTWKSHTAGQNGGNAFDDLNAGAQGKITQIDVGCTDTSINIIKTFYKYKGRSFLNYGVMYLISAKVYQSSRQIFLSHLQHSQFK